MIGHGYKDALLKDYPIANGGFIESVSVRHLLYDSDLGWSCIFAMLRLVYGCDLKDDYGIGIFLTGSDTTVIEIKRDRFVKLVIRWLMCSKADRSIDMSTEDYVMHFHPVSNVPFPPPHAYPWSKCFRGLFFVFYLRRVVKLEDLDIADLNCSLLLLSL